MVTSEHAIMQNEALLALALIVQHAPGNHSGALCNEVLLFRYPGYAGIYKWYT